MLIEPIGLIRFVAEPKAVSSMNRFLSTDLKCTRRTFVRIAAAAIGLTAALERLFSSGSVFAQANTSGLPLPDEPVVATMKRLFGNRTIGSGEGKIKLELPLIAEDGGNVGITVETNLPASGPIHVSSVYLVSDKNRLPMLAKFSFTPESGKAFIATNIRLATTTDVRAIVEMNDGTLYSVSRNVRVTISGCDLPPQS
jgi:sulfur-oxidizing protein SoxY